MTPRLKRLRARQRQRAARPLLRHIRLRVRQAVSWNGRHGVLVEEEPLAGRRDHALDAVAFDFAGEGAEGYLLADGVERPALPVSAETARTGIAGGERPLRTEGGLISV